MRVGRRVSVIGAAAGVTGGEQAAQFDPAHGTGLARLVRASAQYPLIRDFSTTPSHYVEVQPTGRLLGFNNSNRLVSSADWDIQLQKTGYIREAGRCLVMLANVASKPMIIVLLDSWGKMTRIGDANRIKRWVESASLARPAAG